MITKTYSKEWANKTYAEFKSAYSRAVKIFYENYDVSEDRLIECLRTKQKSWCNFKKFIKLIDAFIVKTTGESFNPRCHLNLIESNYKTYAGIDIRPFRKPLSK